MVYIIGIDHLVQYNGPLMPEVLDEFKEFLTSIINELGISMVAEEFNLEFLNDVLGATEGTAKIVAEKSGIDHLYCDPDSEEREILGIPYYADVMDKVKERYGIRDQFITDGDLGKQVKRETADEIKRFWSVRERFWLGKFRKRVNENILFLCGHEHVSGFSALLRDEGVTVMIIDEFWRKDLFSDYGKLGLR